MTRTGADVLRADHMLSKITDELKLDDFGDSLFVRDYERLVEAVFDEVDLSPVGVAVCEEHFHRMLVNRLRIEADIKTHPEILDEVIAPPIVITGFARSGTTKLQQMISAAPSVQALTLWKLLNPAPFPDADPTQQDPRFTFAQTVEQLLKTEYPQMWAAHPTPATNAEEDMLINDMSFIAPSLPMRIGAVRYTEALRVIDPRMYRYTQRVLKYLQWQDPSTNKAQRPWVMKCPVHFGNLATILQVYPGAKVIHCHREVEVSMASTAALSNIAWGMYTDHLDKKLIGDFTLDYWSKDWERNIAQRREVPADAYLDVRFEDINRNGIDVIERIYAFCGLTLDAASRSAMLAWQDGNLRHAHGKHEYNAADYGITTARVQEAFRAYYQHFTHVPAIDA